MSNQPKLTFYTKTPLTCPICDASVPKEELLSGSGRLIAGNLTDELHRKYEKTKKFGNVYPLVYSLPSCPYCYFSAFPSDWTSFNIKTDKNLLKDEQKRAFELSTSILGEINFKKPRHLQEGITSYLIATFTYEHADTDINPTFKQALCTLRGAWLSNYLIQEHPENSSIYRQLATMFYRKASFYYRYSCELEDISTENFTNLSFLGPDQDNNFGFDGVLYLSGLLEFKYGQRSNLKARLMSLNNIKTTISKIVGIGKASKSKPMDILDLSRSLYTAIKKETELLEEQLSKELSS